jgi:hypothetical protein
MKKQFVYTILGLCLALASCNLEKVVEVELPEFKSDLSVEWYIEAGKPFRMTLTESVSYFDSASLPLVNNALVVVSYNGVSDTLRNGLQIVDTTRFFNYTSKKIAPSQAGTVFNMYIKDSKGREARATTTLLPPAKIDSLRLLWNKTDTAASLLTTIVDDPTRKNYFRRFIHKGNLSTRRVSSTWFTDLTATNNRITIGSGFNIKRGDTAIVTLFHIEKDYYDFIQSLDDAQDANGSPFQQPSALKTNISGGIGIFAAIAESRDTLFVPK